MKLASLVLPLALGALAAPPAFAETVQPQQEARIPFVNHGGIRDWRDDGHDTLYVQDRFRHWYKATLMTPAFDLPYTEAIGFDTGPGDTLDKFSAVVVRGQRYQIQSLVPIDGAPPKKLHKRKHG